MGDLFLLSERRMARISPSFPLAHGVPSVDDTTGSQRDRVRHPQWPPVEGRA
jgi:hypothetical protein